LGTDRSAVQPFQLIPHPQAIEIHLIPAGSGQELVQRTLIVFVKIL
jgi:hypothetical protein